MASPSPEPLVTVQMCSPSGEVLAAENLPVQGPAAEAIRTALAAAKKRAKGAFVFLLGTQVIDDRVSLADLGLAANTQVEVTVLDSLRPCFEWGFYASDGRNSIDASERIFTRGDLAHHTDGVRAKAPLPRDARCYVTFRKLGTHASLGVGTAGCTLGRSDYLHLFGQDELSWALCFGRENGQLVTAMHAARVVEVSQIREEQEKGASATYEKKMILPEEALNGFESMSFNFMVTAAGSMHVRLPGHEEDLAVAFGIPKDVEIFVVASTVFGHGRITISPVDDKDSSSPGAAWDSKIFPTEAAEAEEEP
ncbi:SPRY domain-containing SOCS box protein 1 [Durusdinium trenchii]